MKYGYNLTDLQNILSNNLPNQDKIPSKFVYYIVKIWRKEFVDRKLNDFFTNFLKNDVNSVECVYLGVKFFEIIIKIYIKNHMRIRVASLNTENKSSEIQSDHESVEENENSASRNRKDYKKGDEEEYVIEENEDNEEKDNIYNSLLKQKLQKKFYRRSIRIKEKINNGDYKITKDDLRIDSFDNICELCGKKENLLKCTDCLTFFHFECLNIEKLTINGRCKDCQQKKLFIVKKVEKEKVAKKLIFKIIKDR